MLKYLNRFLFLISCLLSGSGEAKRAAAAAPSAWPDSPLLVRAVPVPVLHTENEGSSAMLQSISHAYPCVVSLAEHLAQMHFDSVQNFKDALAKFYDPRGIDPKDLFESMEAHSLEKNAIDSMRASLQVAHSCCAAGFKTFVVAKHYYLKALPERRSRPREYFAMRSDLLRFALSKYRDDNVSYADHPQFNKSFVAPRLHYDVHKLDDAITLSISRWEEHTDYMKSLVLKSRGSCEDIGILRYEDYLKNETLFLQRWYNSLLARSPGRDPRDGGDQFYAYGKNTDIALQKVHSDNIKTFVLNPWEVQHHFDRGNHPTMQAVVEKAAAEIGCTHPDKWFL